MALPTTNVSLGDINYEITANLWGADISLKDLRAKPTNSNRIKNWDTWVSPNAVNGSGVAVPQTGQISASNFLGFTQDGITWSIPYKRNFSKMVWTGSRYITIKSGAGLVLYISSDLINWTESAVYGYEDRTSYDSNSNLTINDMVWVGTGNIGLLVVCTGGQIFASANDSTQLTGWRSISSGTTKSLNSIVSAGSVLMAAGDATGDGSTVTCVISIDNGQSWLPRNIPGNDSIKKLAYASNIGKIVAQHSGSSSIYSTTLSGTYTGLTWTSCSGLSPYAQSIAASPNAFILTYMYGLKGSTDGSAFSSISGTFANNYLYQALNYANGYFYATVSITGSSGTTPRAYLYKSADAPATLSFSTLVEDRIDDYYPRYVHYLNSKLIDSGSGTISTSTDNGATWTKLGSNPFGEFAPIDGAYDPVSGRIVLLCQKPTTPTPFNKLFYSTNGGQTWTAGGSASSLLSICWNGSTFVVSGYSGSTYTSADGSALTFVGTAASGSPVESLASNGSTTVAGAWSGRLSYSSASNASSWTTVTVGSNTFNDVLYHSPTSSYFATSNSGIYKASQSDLNTWTVVNKDSTGTVFTGSFNDIAYGNNILMVTLLSYSANCFKSDSTGTSWSSVTLPYASYSWLVKWNQNSKCWILSDKYNAGSMYISRNDGTTWTVLNTGENPATPVKKYLDCGTFTLGFTQPFYGAYTISPAKKGPVKF